MSSESGEPPLVERKWLRTDSSVISSSDRPSKKLRTTKTIPDLKGNDWVNQICHGTDQQDGMNLLTESQVAHAPANSSSYMGKIYPEVNSLSERPHTLLKEYRPPNGSGSFGGNPSTSITSSLQLSALRSMKIGRRALEKHLLLSTRARQRGKLGMQPTGQRHGDGPQRQSSSLSLTEEKSWIDTRHTSRSSLTPDNHTRIRESLPTTLPSGISLEGDRHHYSPNATNSPTYIQPSSYLTESNSPPPTPPPRHVEASLLRHQKESRPATNTTPTQAAHTARVSTNTFARNVEEITLKMNTTHQSKDEGLQPKYRRYNLWGADNQSP